MLVEFFHGKKLRIICVVNCEIVLLHNFFVILKFEVYISVTCVNLPPGVEPTVQRVCEGLRADQQLVTLFSENYVPVNCRSSLEGVWQFAYQVRLIPLFIKYSS